MHTLLYKEALMKTLLYYLNLLLSVMVTGNIFSMQQKRILKKEITSPDQYNCHSFHWLVTQPKLNDSELIHNNRHYYGINHQDANGDTPLHLLALRPDATIKQVEAMIKRGADPTLCNNIKKATNGDILMGYNVYTNGIQHIQSPSTSFNHIYYGNKDVMLYILHESLCRKIKIFKKEQRENNSSAQQ